MLKRYGEKALEEIAARADELAAAGDREGATTWRRISHAVVQLANQTAPRADALIHQIRPRKAAAGPAPCPINSAP